MFRAKFTVSEVKKIARENGQVDENTFVKLIPCFDKGNEEDKHFSKYTPSEEITLAVNNPFVISQIETGKKFYVDFTEVEES